MVSCVCNTSNLFFVGITGEGGLLVVFMVLLSLTVGSCVLFSSWIRTRSSSVFSGLSGSLLDLPTSFGCGLSFRVFCAESLMLMLFSLSVFGEIAFLLLVFFVGITEGSVFLLSASLSMSPIFLFILLLLFFFSYL